VNLRPLFAARRQKRKMRSSQKDAIQIPEKEKHPYN
jgi:hypothetical protein